MKRRQTSDWDTALDQETLLLENRCLQDIVIWYAVAFDHAWDWYQATRDSAIHKNWLVGQGAVNICTPLHQEIHLTLWIHIFPLGKQSYRRAISRVNQEANRKTTNGFQSIFWPKNCPIQKMLVANQQTNPHHFLLVPVASGRWPRLAAKWIASPEQNWSWAEEGVFFNNDAITRCKTKEYLENLINPTQKSPKYIGLSFIGKLHRGYPTDSTMTFVSTKRS